MEPVRPASKARRPHLAGATILVLFAALALYLAYLTYTSYGERNYDADAHVTYVRYLVEHHRLPPAAHCFVCHHPPLYYLLAAVVYAGCQAAGMQSPVDGLQWLSLALTAGFVAWSVLLVSRFTHRAATVALATALVVFWPYAVINSVRVHNDTLAAPLFVGALYFLVCWQQAGRERDLWLGALCTALAIWTRANGYVLALLLVGAVGWPLVRPRSAGRPRRAWRPLLPVVMVAVAAGLLPLARPPLPNASWCDRVLGMACRIDARYFVGNRPANYLLVDAPAYWREPYLIAEWDDAGRQYFWNHLLKSSLFGTHNNVPDRETTYAHNRELAQGLNVLLLGLSAYLALGFVVARRELWARSRLLVAACGLSLAGLLAFRIAIPAPHHTDFRHIFPVLVPLSLWYALAVEAHARQGRAWLAATGWALAIPFVVLSALYFLPKREWLVHHTTVRRVVALSDYAEVARPGAPWSRRENLQLEPNSEVRLLVRAGSTASRLDASFDNNDRYEVTLVGGHERRRLVLGPSPNVRRGLARYREVVAPPVEDVREVIVRPLTGDLSLAMGHLVLE